MIVCESCDFIFTVVGEELGFVGVLTVVALFALIVHRAFIIGRAAARARRKAASRLTRIT